MSNFKYVPLLLILLIPSHMIMASGNSAHFNQALAKSLHFKDKDQILISTELSPLFELIPESLANDFLLLMQEIALIPASQQKLSKIRENDATIAAPNAHRIVYENDSLRILESRLKPGQFVPFHTHQWDNIILIIQGSRFRCDDGENIIEEEWLPSIEQVEGNFHAYSYKNIGLTEFRALVFEFKK